MDISQHLDKGVLGTPHFYTPTLPWLLGLCGDPGGERVVIQGGNSNIIILVNGYWVHITH